MRADRAGTAAGRQQHALSAGCRPVPLHFALA